MSEFENWDEGVSSSYPAAQKRRPLTSGGAGGGKWYFPLTLLGLVLVGGLSILMCFLTKDVRDRSILLIGLIFMVPAGAMFFSAMLLEFQTGAMTPQTSRKSQVIVAVVATLLTFLVGCICDAIYLYGGIRNAGVNYVLAVDRGDTVSWSAYGTADSPTRGEEINACAERLLAKMPSYTDVGVVTFAWETVALHPVQKAKDDFKSRLPDMLSGTGNTGVSFRNALEAAVDIAVQADNKLPTRILLITGGDEAVYLVDDNGDVYDEVADQQRFNDRTLNTENARQEIISKLNAAGCTLYVVSPTGAIHEGLMQVVQATGGLCVSIAEADTVPEFVSIITIDGDMLRATSLPAKILTGVMLLLEGLVVGVCISIMLSRSGQLRVQMFLSPVLAIVSFVMVKLLGTPDSNPVGTWWLWEGLSFLPLGLIFMKGNDFARVQQPVSFGEDWQQVGSSNGGADFTDDVSDSGSDSDW